MLRKSRCRYGKPPIVAWRWAAERLGFRKETVMADLLQADRIETIDTLGMIALAEAVGFDDLEFTPLVRDLLLASPLRLERGAVTLAVGRGDKRIIFESAGDPDDDDGQACLREAVFIVLPEAGSGMALSSRMLEKIGRHASQRSHVCLFYRNRDGRELLDAFRAHLWGGVEWHSKLPGAVCREGLLFSAGWDRQVALHVARALERYARELPDGTGLSISLIAPGAC
ncbi:hypothetical protein Q3P06_09630 [Ralstonia pseudosolanacearum]|uniref:hypothetical protein n=1 Tax=Ralstonia pseudosolanacearum TaxID=1310165 RepID=UPI0026763399|nr:hypothetical protein [Ralstonia pseudosolanacearum]MDO3512177.1 hypothetical protein [Ralstonia pseudosolanacearum]MDO3537068.1 hypothetical protein [Ralstonia pseudosolanacearum]MDO3630176.1 hypothetical protein [Ralstonia pseudosolanacearum]